MNLVYKIFGFLLPAINTIVGRVLFALGFGYVQFVGLNLLIESTMQKITQNITSFSSSNIGTILAWAGFFKIDIHLTIIISAIGVKVLLNSFNSNTITKLVQR